ncbi:MAG: HPr family phosphocarrier protein [Clostridiaceae bacterium]|jgi:phosphotransferase system HPr (HPr) family protein|nr:HPr family phosphocarrier protein [Bacillota bacterium]NLN52090.1 HPr family phosphocarrier protein [Clostridiaceae bacterium]
MTTKSILINWEEGIEMKSIALLIQKASVFDSTIYISRDDRRANAKSLLGMMSLGIEDGVELDITAEGIDAEEAVNTVADFLENPQT